MRGEGVEAIRGRSAECQAIDELCDEVRAGASATLVIRGEAGVGKTALLRYAAERAAGDFWVAEVVGVESEMELAYAGLHQLCSPMFDRLDGLPEPQRSALNVAFGRSEGAVPDTFLVGLATLSLLARAAENRPLMCLVDDPQWLDDASEKVLGFVARRLGAESVAMIFAVRHVQAGSGFAGMPEMRLSGVADEDARTLLASVVPGRLDERVRDRIIAETQGNPLALLELPRGMTNAELAGGFALPPFGAISAQIEDNYVTRIRNLPEPTRRLLLLASADTAGDTTILWRAAATLGLDADAAAPAVRERLLDLGARVRFRHPLVRSAAYHSASAADRREVHRALAEAIDPAVDPDRRVWHRANATADPDGEVADELERCSGRSQARGGFAAAAALLERAASLTPERDVRVERRLAAAGAHLQAGAFDAAMALLAAAESEVADEFARARVELLRGLTASASSFGSEAPRRLLKAARRLQSIDVDLARRTYLDAWGAALFAGHLASAGGDLTAVSRAAKAAPRALDSMGSFDELLDGLATLITEGRSAAAPTLRRAVDDLVSGDVSAEDWLHWGVLASSSAVTLWDFESWATTSGRQVELARASGGLAALSIALNGHGMIAAWRGEFDTAAALVAEDAAIKHATGAKIAPYGAMLLAAYQGRVSEASALIAETVEDSVARGEGLGVDLARWTAAILHNGVARYPEALAFASPASSETPGLYISTWMLPERIEAAVRSGQPEVAAAALREFQASAFPGSSDWGLGIEARCRAMLTDGEEAKDLYCEAVDRLARTPIRTELARAHLVYGEWLRRENRRTDARAELHTAHEMFLAMSADGFAERTRHELLVAGEHVGKRRDDSPTELTPQEEHIARLARDGRTNAEIAAELYISARTVEWHLRKVFAKFNITSRRELRTALPTRSRYTELVS